jgi:hypothetical protein
MSQVPHRVTSLADIDALVGQYITLETPESYWEDSHGYFQFHTEIEAKQALRDPYYQRFLTDLDWKKTIIREVRVYRRYTSDPEANWILCDKAVSRFGILSIARETGWWHAAFGKSPQAQGRIPTIAICLAALRAADVHFEVDYAQVDAFLGRGFGGLCPQSGRERRG